MKNLLVVLSAVVFFLGLFGIEGHATTINLYAIADASLRSDAPNINDGAGSSYAVLEDFKLNRGLISWETPSDLLGSKVNSAYLKLYVRYLNVQWWSNPNTVLNIHQVSQDWAEHEVTWNTAAGNSEDFSSPFVSGTFNKMPYIDETPTEGYTILIDVTELVQNWADGAENYGFMVVAGNRSVNTFFTKEAGDLGAAELAIDFEAVIETVLIDIKPGACPNPFNVKSKGLLPVAILGTENLDVTGIDIASVRLNGVAPLRSSIEDISRPANVEQCDEFGSDYYDDLMLKFDTQEIAASLGDVEDGEEIELTLIGALSDGTIIEGIDSVTIIKKGKKKKGKN